MTPPPSSRFYSQDDPPLARKSDDVLHLHGETVPAPYRWLRDLQSQETRDFITHQERYYQNSIASHLNGEEDTADFLARVMETPVKGIPVDVGDKYLFYYKGAEDKTHKLMIADTPEAKGRVLVDPAVETDDPAAMLQSVHISPDGKHIACRITTGGAWEAPARIMNVETGAYLDDEISKTGTIWWDKDGKGFSYNHRSTEDPERIIIKHHTLGTDAAADQTVYDDPNQPKRAGAFSHSYFRGTCRYDGPEEWFFTATHDMFADLYLKDAESGEHIKLFEGTDGHHLPVAATEDGILMYTTRDAPNGKLVLFDPQNPDPAQWKTVIAENEKDALQHVFTQKGKIMALYNKDAADELRVFDQNGKFENTVPLPPGSRIRLAHSGIPGNGLGQNMPIPATDEVFLSVTNFTNPDTVFRYDISQKTAAPLMESTLPPDMPDCIVEQLWTTSADGKTKVPMSVMRRKDTVLDGTAALKLTGYGAHGMGSGPQFSAEAADFVRSGGIFVQANIRGGNEFGADWHEQGRLRNKHNSFDDFIACAQHLADQNYTSPSRIVAEGHSSGGLLVLASALKQPQAFGGIIAGAPVADMIREDSPWHAEYGDAFKNKADFDYLKSYAPLMNIKNDTAYPAFLVRTGAQDTLLAGDAYQFIATMQEISPETTSLLHVEKDYGHGTARPKDVEIAETVAKKAFVEQSIGPINQQEFKKELAAGLRSLRRNDKTAVQKSSFLAAKT